MGTNAISPLMSGIVCAISAVLFVLVAGRYRTRVPRPPGPPAEPFIGHLRLIPKARRHLFYYDLSKKYGKVLSLWTPRRTFIVLNSTKAAIDLLEKRSAIYSDRIGSKLLLLMGWTEGTVFTRYNKEFKRRRTLFNDYFSREKCLTYHDYQEAEAGRLVNNLRDSPGDFIDHIGLFSSAIILRIVHGHQLLSSDDPYFDIMSDVSRLMPTVPNPGSSTVDLIPFLHLFPSWFPGTYPATRAREIRPSILRMLNYPFEDVKKQLDEGRALDSFLSAHISGLQAAAQGGSPGPYPYSTDEIKGVAAVSYMAGTDTTWATIVTFMLAMVLYPEVQDTIQAEMDKVVGRDPDRVPTFADRPRLAYLECALQETYRWHNAVPSGLPHRCMEDDVYEGMFIPKGSIVIANTRGMTLDEETYKHADKFDPERYSRGEPPVIGHFGFGRRICPGRYLADASVWIAIASIVSTFRISPAIGEDGEPVVPREEFVSGITNRPKAFRCSITPRRGGGGA